MFRTMFLLSVIAALSATPLRQAEAADDLARSLAETGQGDVLEPADGGVGDDSDNSLKTSAPSSALDPRPPLAPPLDATPFVAPAAEHVRQSRSPGAAVCASSRRLAWLQCFLL